jgi:actinin alpha
LDGTSEDLVDMFIVHTVDEIQGLIDAHNQVCPVLPEYRVFHLYLTMLNYDVVLVFSQFKATLGEADKEYNSIVSLVKEVESMAQKYQVPGGLENPYTTLTANVSSNLVF